MAAAGDSETGGLHVLDIACGTGDFSIAIAKEMLRRAAGNRDAAQSQEDTDAGDFLRTGGYWPGKVIGVDLSEGMLKIMGEKVRAAGLEKMISYETGDCENLRFEDGTFDRVTVAFGVRNFENREKGLKEMLRVLRPGGELVILELSVPSNAVMRWLYKLYFLHILPIIGGKVSGDKAAYKYLPGVGANFPGKKEFMQTLRDCGYRMTVISRSHSVSAGCTAVKNNGTEFAGILLTLQAGVMSCGRLSEESYNKIIYLVEWHLTLIHLRLQR